VIIYLITVVGFVPSIKKTVQMSTWEIV